MKVSRPLKRCLNDDIDFGCNSGKPDDFDFDCITAMVVVSAHPS